MDQSTWGDFAKLVEKHNGVWGGCWCMSFHFEKGGFGNRSVAEVRSEKKRRVWEGRSHSALVYDGSTLVGWCQFGPAAELPRIKNKQAYLEDLVKLPDWRITCFFIDRERRGEGVARAALKGALHEIALKGGGSVESYPEDVEGRSVSTSFLYNGTVAMFEREGFKRTRRLGTNHWVVTKDVRRKVQARAARATKNSQKPDPP